MGDTFQGFVEGRHPSFCPPPLPTHWLLATLGWSVIHFREPLHSNYQRGVRGKVSSWDALPYGPRWNISNQGEAISSWHIINHTCRGFPLGSSSDTSENTPPDVRLNQRDTPRGTGISTGTFRKSVKVERRGRSAAPPPTPSPQPLFSPILVGLIWIRSCFSHYSPHRLNRSWQHVWGEAQQNRLQTREGKEFVNA